MTDVYLLMSFNSDGHAMQRNVFTLDETVFDDIAEIAEGALLVMTNAMFDNQPPLSLMKYSGHITSADDSENLAHMVSRLSDRDSAGKVLVFGNDDMMSALDDENCPYTLVTIAPSEFNEAIPDKYTDGYEFTRKCVTSTGKYDVKMYRQSLKSTSDNKVLDIIDNIDRIFDESDASDDSPELDDFLTHLEDSKEKRESFSQDLFNAGLDGDEGGGISDGYLSMIKTVANQVTQAINTILTMRNKISDMGNRVNSAMEHVNKVSLDLSSHTNSKLVEMDNRINGLANQVGLVVEESEKHRTRLIWVLLVVSLVLNVINLFL